MSQVDKEITNVLSSAGKRLYGHYDYFGYIIPSTWFLFGCYVTEAFISGDRGILRDAGACLEGVSTALSANSGLAIILGLILLIVLFNLVYILGHLLNSLSAMVLDRWVVRRLLHYPFHLYEKYKSSPDDCSTHQIFKEIVASSSYSVYCINLLPLVVLEAILSIFVRNHPGVVQRGVATMLIVGFVTFVLTIIHLGVPRIQFKRKLKSLKNRLGLLHLALVITLVAWIHYSLYSNDDCWALMALPAFNFIAVLVDQALHNVKIGQKANTAISSQSSSMRDSLRAKFTKFASLSRNRRILAAAIAFLKRTMPNFFYFFANIADYSDAPSKELLDVTWEYFGDDFKKPSDYYWLANMLVEKAGGIHYETSYHFLCMYGMNRNLSNATNVILLFGALRLALLARAPYSGYVYVWLGVLLIMSVSWFIRYLYIYAGYYSKYLVRFAAFSSAVESDKV